MSVTVVVLGADARAVIIAPDVAAGLRRLGVSDAALVDGSTGSALVLSGWDFDGRRHEAALLDLVAPGRSVAVMHGVADVVFDPAAEPASQPTTWRSW